MKKKLLAMLLVMALVLSMAPMVMFADEPISEADEHVHDTGCQIDTTGNVNYYDANGKTDGIGNNNFVVSTSKTVVALENENEFEITLGVKTTQNTNIEPIYPDVAVTLVIDISTSMQYLVNSNSAGTLYDSTNYNSYKDGTSRMAKAKVAARNFLVSYAASSNGAARWVSIVSFGSQGRIVRSWFNISTPANLAAALSDIDSLVATSGQYTFLQGGLALARNLMKVSTVANLSNRFVVALTDGNPTYSKVSTSTDIGAATGTTVTGGATVPSSINTPESDPNVGYARERAWAVAQELSDVQIYTVGLSLASNLFQITSTNTTTTMKASDWLAGYIASSPSNLHHFNAGSEQDLKIAFDKISERITETWAQAYLVTDPMGPGIVFNGFSGGYTERQAQWNAEENLFVWDLKKLTPDDTYRRDDNITVYSFILKYKISLDTFTRIEKTSTNLPTTLSYAIYEQKGNGAPTELGNVQTADFAIPEVHGFAAGLSFTKVGENSLPLEGAEFTLYYGEDEFMTATSGEDGTVSFEGIPSGHSYTLAETEAPQDYDLANTQYPIIVSYGEITGNPIAGNQIVNEKTKVYTGGQISIAKTVLSKGEKALIADWLTDEGYASEINEIFGDIIFELYESNAAGDIDDSAEPIDFGTIGQNSMITFANVHPSGWYLVREKSGPIASEIFKDGIPDLLVYFDEVSEVASTNTSNIDENTAFTIEQFSGADVSRPVQVVYKANDGTIFNLKQTPKLDVAGSPNGGGALITFKFVATDNNDNKYLSFCADSGAVGVKGNYYPDKTNHGFSDLQMQWLVAALDYVYSTYNFEEYESLAIAQLVVWNMIIKYNGPAISDMWLRDKIENDQYYKYYSDRFGEISKIEAANYNNGAKLWSNPASVNSIVNSIVGNPDYYLDLYNAKVQKGTEKYISNAIFLKGDPSSLEAKFRDMMYKDLNIYQQRQLILVFTDPATFVNKPSGIKIAKKVLADGEEVLIKDWLEANNNGLDVNEVLADITFELIDGTEPIGYGKIGQDSMITFDNELSSGWYLVHENLGTIASEIFKETPDLIVFFDEETKTVTSYKSVETEEGPSNTLEQCDDPAVFYNEPIEIDTPDFGSLEAKVEVKAYEDGYNWVLGTQTKTGTLVTYVGATDAKKNTGGYNKAGDYIDGAGGGFTAIAVNVKGLNDRTFYIANSGHGNPKVQEEKDKIPLTYTVEVVDGNIIVSFDENFVSAQIAYGVYTKISDIKWAPGQYNVSKGHIDNTSGTIQMPLPTNAGSVVYLAIHISSVKYNDGTGSWQYVGRSEVAYAGALSLMVTGPDGVEYGPYSLKNSSDDDAFIANGTVTVFGVSDLTNEKFVEGEYTLTLTGDGFPAIIKTVSVEKDTTTTVDFGTIEVTIK